MYQYLRRIVGGLFGFDLDHAKWIRALGLLTKVQIWTQRG